jgi:drug/metabolite transporter (DMT)-like permease
VWYVVANSRFLKQHPAITYSDWATIMGTVTLAWVLVFAAVALILAPAEHQEKYWVLDERLLSFLIGGSILGFICSWLGTYLWNLGSQRLPISLAGPLTIFETIFGLLFVYLAEQNLPTLAEIIGIITILSGVGMSLSIFHKPKEVFNIKLNAS